MKPIAVALHRASAAVAALALAAADKPASRPRPAPDFFYRASQLPREGGVREEDSPTK